MTKINILDKKDNDVKESAKEFICPDCGARLIPESGCIYCPFCGFSECH